MEESCLFGPVINISAIEVYDSAYISLVAVMESGTRIYFSTTGGNRPTSLQIAHVRMPPGYTGSTPAQRPSKVRTAIYSRGTVVSSRFPAFFPQRMAVSVLSFAGTCLLINSPEGCQDKLWCLSADLTPFSPLLSETLSIAPLDGIVWSVERCNFNMLLTSVIPEPPLLVTQHYEVSTKYVCLTDKVSTRREYDAASKCCRQRALYTLYWFSGFGNLPEITAGGCATRDIRRGIRSG